MYQTWTVTGIDVATFRAAVAAAVRAPSAYNAQPWRFMLRDGAIDVRIDPYRQLPIADPHQWAARIAYGAAITNIRLSLAVAGLDTRTRLWPAPDDPLLVATVAAGESRNPSPRQRALHAAIVGRHSNRRPFFDAPVPAEARADLEAAVVGTGAWIALVHEREPVARIAEIVRTADRCLRRDAAYVAEMDAWIARVYTDGSGIPADAVGTAPNGRDLLAMRDYGGPERAAGRDFESDPLLAIVGTHGDSRHDDVNAGMALQRVLLTATDARLATSLLSQPIELAGSRAELLAAVGRHGAAQMVVRVGFGQPVGASGRRPIDSAIDLADCW